MKNAAVILNGCGAKDGSEIHEAVFCLLALQEQGFNPQAFAIDAPQTEVVDHLRGTQLKETRNMLTEAARIARGNILPLSECSVSAFSCLVIPGGFGTAKNLCDYARQGAKMSVRPEVETLITAFYEAKKPIGAVCIAPVIVGKVLGRHGVTLTLGNDSDAAAHLAGWGAVHQVCKPGDCVVDAQHRIVSTPAYMYGDSTLPPVYYGIRKMVEVLAKLM